MAASIYPTLPTRRRTERGSCSTLGSEHLFGDGDRLKLGLDVDMQVGLM